MRARIVKRVHVDGTVEYVIQQRHFLFRWCWVDAWLNDWCGAACRDSWPTLEEAQKNLCYFDDSQSRDEVVG